jgi:membrane protein YdbS with pleckstrin-like domain
VGFAAYPKGMSARSERDTATDAALFSAGLHPMSCAGAFGLAVFIGFVGTLVIRHNDLSAATDMRVAAGTLALCLAAVAGPLRRLWRSELVVTPAELRMRLGTWRSRETHIPLREVRGLDVRSTALGRRLDFGTLTVAAREDDLFVVHHVRAAAALHDAIRRGSGRR